MVRTMLRSMPSEDAAKAVSALHALCRSNPKALYPVVIATRREVGREKASEFAHEMLKRLPVAFIAYLTAATRDDSLCKQLESQGDPLLTSYLAANLREGWRVLDWRMPNIGDHREMTFEERQRRRQAQAELQRLAKQAVPGFLEAFDQNKNDPYHLYVNIGILEELLHHAEVDPQRLHQIVIPVPYEPGTALDLLLHRYVDRSRSLDVAEMENQAVFGVGMGRGAVDRRDECSCSFWDSKLAPRIAREGGQK